MSQHDFTVDNGDGATVRGDTNAALQALASNSSGATAPTTTFAFMLWADTANDLLKQRNAANSAWISVLTLSTGKAVTAASADSVPNGSITPAKTEMGALPSCIRLNTANGYGSTNTKIRRFTNVVLNQGTDITYTASATLGDSFAINKNGVYAISYNDQFNTVGSVGITLNDTAPTTVLYSIPVGQILSACYNDVASHFGVVSATVYLSSGDVVRAHTDGDASGSNTNCCQFTITRVA